MTDMVVHGAHMRPAIFGTLVGCLALAMAPWFTGGQEPVGRLVSAFALLLAGLLVWRQPEPLRHLRPGVLGASFGILIGFALLSLLWSANRYSSIVWVSQWVMAGLAFWLAYVIAGERQGRRWMSLAYLISAGLFCVVGIGIYLTTEYPRFTGTFYWPNPGAAYLIPAILMTLEGMRRAKGRIAWQWASVLVLFGTSFLLTDSRATTLVLFIVLGVYLLISRLSKRFWIHFVFIWVIAFAFSFGLIALSSITAHHSSTALPGSRFAQGDGGQSKSLSDRLNYIDSAFAMWFRYPLGGTGAGTYGDVHPGYQQRVISASTNAHNVYVQTLAELGLVGAVALASVLLWLGFGMLRGLISWPQMMPAALGFGALLLHFGLDIDASYPALLMLAAVLAGLTYRSWREVHAVSSWRGPVLSLLLLPPMVGIYQSDVWAQRGQISQDNSDFSEAAARYDLAAKGIAYNPDFLNAAGINYYAVAATGIKDAQAANSFALERARTAQGQDPYDAQHYQLEGRVLALQNKLPEAAAAFRKALELDPFNHPDYALDLASVQVRQNNVDAALKTARDMLALYPKDVVDNRNSDETLRPNLANLEALAGNIYLRRGDKRGAQAAAKAALKYDPRSLRGRALQHQLLY